MNVVDRSNPWWFRADWDDVDPHLARWMQERVRWVPRWIYQVPLEPPALNFVYGPRQTGKTTGVKLLVRDLLRTADPHCVAYVDLDAVVSLSEFRRALSYIAGMWERRCRGATYLFLDEVTSLPGWWRAVKYFVDSGVLGRAVVTATGSSAVGLAKTPERFPGRRGMCWCCRLTFPATWRFTAARGTRRLSSTYLRSSSRRGLPQVYQ